MHLSLWYSFTLFVIFAFSLGRSLTNANEEKKVYIVYMGGLPLDPNYSPNAHHLSMLQRVVGSSYIEKSLIRSYNRSFNGFAARLTEREAVKLSRDETVISIFPSKTYHLLTTRSWDFMSFPQNVHRNLNGEGDIIIGMLDSGIWPENPSFNDHGFGPIPTKWKGQCKGGDDFKCNKKIIGARTYNKTSCRDSIGHGSHTASIAAGNIVQNASFYGIAGGVARGGAPSARIAVYKVCSESGCDVEQIMAGFDDAIADGVDILSISFGPSAPLELHEDVVAIGSFHAEEKGILSVQAAGNTRFQVAGITSNAPWLFSVAASTIDRRLYTDIVFGNGTILKGRSINSFKLNGTQFPVVYGAEASSKCDLRDAQICSYGCIDPKLVKGKIILCQSIFAEKTSYIAGAIGFIAPVDFSESYVSPIVSTFLTDEQFEFAESYYSSTKTPTMNMLKTVDQRDLAAPLVAEFSSRGPNSQILDILKPDIIAPGVEILAGYSPYSPPSGVPNYDYGHNEFSYGAGHLNPVKAANPGIVYKTTKEEYHNLLCSMNISSDTATKMSGFNISCDDYQRGFKPKDLNYPSMASPIESGHGKFQVQFKRRATNVGVAMSMYYAKLSCYQSPCNATVAPEKLEFKALNEEIPFVVTVSGENLESVLSASLEWNDGTQVARSPIVVFNPKIMASA
ncbi:OLC1v1015580C1 [Oldenlandia corymbosa var. corymbosa]|uniref:OLC1v1015580C1 n=1 Tax=Oldenlandia corymbosa var. corymbosa TaxID=529605 RepID=A0AAV1E6Q8_OLDCO|nr:OLC1v1015580C1 [Oldenlandia corymbosa var. corymbosa]